MANSAWNNGNYAGTQGKPLPNLNNMTPQQKTQTTLGWQNGSKKK